MRDPSKPPAVLFVCLGNTCRSVMAEALASRDLGDRVRFASAGLRPQSREDSQTTVAMLKSEFGLDATGHVPRGIEEVALSEFDYVVAMDRDIARQIVDVPKSKLIIWRVDDPWGRPHEYKVCAQQVLKELSLLNDLWEDLAG